MSRNALLQTALIASVCAAGSAHAGDAALFSDAGQLNSGKAMLAKDGIAGLGGLKTDGSFAAQRTVTFSGGDLFASAPAGSPVTFADPALVAKLTGAVTGYPGAKTFSGDGSVGLTGSDALGGGAFASGTAAGLDGSVSKNGTFSGGGAVGLSGSEASKSGTFSAGGAASLTTPAGPLASALAARAALMSLSK
jgi:hypothetical protein